MNSAKRKRSKEPRSDKTVIVQKSYTVVSKELMIVNGPYFTRLTLTVLQPFLDVSYIAKNCQNRPEN